MSETLQIEIKKTTVENRQKIADRLGVSIDVLMLLGIESLLLRLLNKLNEPWTDGFADIQEEEA